MSAMLKRREVVAKLLADRSPELLIVTGLGAPAYDVTAVADNHLNFPLWGGMGGAVPLGVGLALAQPKKRVLVLTGDGEMLMGMGSLATIGVQQPDNLFIVVFDNGLYGETGMQESHTSATVDLCSVARGCGFERVFDVKDEDGLRALAILLRTSQRMLFARIRILPDDPPRALPEKDGVAIKQRVRGAVDRMKAV